MLYMRESITKFDLEAAFKALDELDIPEASKGIRANRAPIKEVFSQKTKFDALFEDYYDVNDQSDLAAAKGDREAEVAMAKLARIEKIVDLDAESPDDLLASYVGKFIIQCPQCMTLFYKKPDDVEASEEDPETVNVNEVCQHCGNDSGYTLIGKVGEATQEPTEEDPLTLDVDSNAEAGAEDASTEAEGAEEPAAGGEGADAEDATASEDDLDLGDDFMLDLEDTNEEEKTEESFTTHNGDYLAERFDSSKPEFEEEEEPETVAEMPIEENTNFNVSDDEFMRFIKACGTHRFGNGLTEGVENPDMTEITEGTTVNNETLLYAVINADGTYAGVPCTSAEEAKELASQQKGRIIVKLEDVDIDS
jgi:hypothetical protein